MTKFIAFTIVLALHYGAYLYFNGDEPLMEKQEPEKQQVQKRPKKVKVEKKKRKMSLSDLSMQGSKIVDEERLIAPRQKQQFSYCLPYKAGNTFTVTQTSDGPTHKGKMKYAIDFNLNTGAEVSAARAGRVIEVVGHFKSRGRTEEFYNKANRVVIQHQDESVALYGHLRPNGTNVEMGEYVKEGQVIGYSGETGFVSGAHLHFAVGHFKNGVLESMPIRFELESGIISYLETKRKYKAFMGCRSKAL